MIAEQVRKGCEDGRKFNFKKQMNIQLKQDVTEENILKTQYELKAQKNYFRVDLMHSHQYNRADVKEKLEKQITSSEYADDIEIICT